MTKQMIMQYFCDINMAYNDSSKYDTLARMLDEFRIEIAHEMVSGSVLMYQGQELVRCKDCKHCYFASNRIPCEQSLSCGKHGMDITPDWFCADGERKEGR